MNTLNCRLIFFFFNFRNKVSQKNISSLHYKSVNLILDALSSEFHSTSSTSESPQKKEQWEKSEQKTKIMETVKLEGEKEIKKTCIKLLRKVDVNSNNNYVIIMWHQ